MHIDDSNSAPTYFSVDVIDPLIYDYDTNHLINYNQIKPTKNSQDQTNIITEAQLASKLPPQEIYGALNDEQTYFNTLKLYLNSTCETANRQYFFEKYIQNNTIRDHFAEVGVGDGAITKILSKGFNNATLIDNNNTALNQQILNNLSNRNVYKINKSISDLSLPPQKFDAIILSHVIYYLDRNKIISLLLKLFSSLKENGELVIVLSGGLDKQKIIEDFNGNLIDLSKFTLQLSHAFKRKISIWDTKETSIAYTEHVALNIAGFYLCDGKAIATKSDLALYIKQFKKENKSYQLDFIQRFFIIKNDKSFTEVK